MWLETEPKKEVPEVWACLTPDEAFQLIEALENWVEMGQDDPGWHAHITDSGRELTIAISSVFDEAYFAKWYGRKAAAPEDAAMDEGGDEPP